MEEERKRTRRERERRGERRKKGNSFRHASFVPESGIDFRRGKDEEILTKKKETH
ncbi:hypothetical protein ISS21_01140 [Patescibacteria group bacterium]|nr:hypothetical protein [Patescibacteria group bacterium]